MMSKPFRHSPERHLVRWTVATILIAAGVGCGRDRADMDTEGTAAASGVAFLSSSYETQATSVSLFDPATSELVDDCVHSGGGQAGLVQDLSGDVTLPSRQQIGGELIVIDRKNAVLSFVNPAGCQVRTQISVGNGFRANPQDVVVVSSRKAYVSRYETNPAQTPDPADFDEGSDLLIIDPATPAVLGRIDLAPYAGIAGGGAATGAAIEARPDRVLLAGGRLYVVLGNLSTDFASAAPGRIVVVDTTTDAVTAMLDLPDLTGCSAIEHSAETGRLYVACGGHFGSPSQTEESGVAEIDISGAAPMLVRTFRGTALGEQPVNFASVALLGGYVFVATLGAQDFATGQQLAPDAFFAVALASGQVTKLFEGGAYNLGKPTAHPGSRRVFLPDGDAVNPRVHMFDLSSGAPVAAGEMQVNPAGGLPPREATLY